MLQKFEVTLLEILGEFPERGSQSGPSGIASPCIARTASIFLSAMDLACAGVPRFSSQHLQHGVTGAMQETCLGDCPTRSAR
jgi:hypothetical protein